MDSLSSAWAANATRGAPAVPAVPAAGPSAFPDIAAFNEGCCGDGGLDALGSLEPIFEPVPEPADRRLRGRSFPARGHPSLGERQRRFEWQHHEASVTFEMSWKCPRGRQITMRLVLFRRSGEMLHNLYNSVFEYLLVLRARGFTGGEGPTVVVDVGASIGPIAIAVALTYPQARVFAVEPAPQNFRYLAWNIRDNNVTSRVWPVNAALRGSHEPPQLDLRYSPTLPIASSFCDRGDGCDFEPYTVEALTLADLFRRLGTRRVDWMKVDCEGCEWRMAEDPAFLPLVRDACALLTAELHMSQIDRARDEGWRFAEALCAESDAGTQARVLQYQGGFAMAETCTAAHRFPDAAYARDVLFGREQGLASPPSGGPAGLRHGVEDPAVGFVGAAAAAAFCSAAGARLCTAAELGARLVPWGGRELDEEFVWSATPCAAGAAGALAVRAAGGAGAALAECRRFAYGGRCCPGAAADAAGSGGAAGRGTASAGAWAAAATVPPPLGAALPRVFVLSSFSHDDADQWPLIPHWIGHYRDTLGLPPETFLLILHSDSRNTSGLAKMDRWLRADFGVRHTYHEIEPYTALRHMAVKWKILREHVAASDWVMQVDADELVVFPRSRTSRVAAAPSPRAAEFLAELDAQGHNVQWGLMIDRLAADGSVDHVPHGGPATLFAQFPLNCAVTLLLQQSDVRKASAYRGYLRATTGNHQVLGLNSTLFAASARFDAVARVWTRKVRKHMEEHFGLDVFSLLPGSYIAQKMMPEIRAAPLYATVYHFKWIKGLSYKLERRAITEDETAGFYDSIRQELAEGHLVPHRDLQRLCNFRELSGLMGSTRPLTSKEVMMLFQNVKEEHIDYLLNKDWGIAKRRQDEYVAKMIRLTLDRNMARDGQDWVPVV